MVFPPPKYTDNYFCVNYDGSKSAWEVMVFPPPKYKALSMSSKRIQSLGEGGKSTVKSSQRNRKGVRTTMETETTATPTLTESLMDDMLSSRRSTRRKLKFEMICCPLTKRDNQALKR